VRFSRTCHIVSVLVPSFQTEIHPPLSKQALHTSTAKTWASFVKISAFIVVFRFCHRLRSGPYQGGGAKSLLRGAQNLELCPTHFQGGE